MTTVLFSMGAVVASTLLGLMILTLLVPRLRIWPTPGNGTWQSFTFWPLFRALNVLCFAVALADLGSNHLGLPLWLRSAAVALLAGSLALFVYAFRVLGRDNSYCAQDGLVTAGIYQWSRNPQNAMLIVVYGALAFTADSASTYTLSAAMMLVYALMVLAEEPWLEKSYGEAYRVYCRQVPRFFNWRRLGNAIRASWRSVSSSG